jgi:hypothetical protein
VQLEIWLDGAEKVRCSEELGKCGRDCAWHEVDGNGAEKKGGGEDVKTYFGGIPPPDCWFWPLHSEHADEDLEVLVLHLQCRSIG